MNKLQVSFEKICFFFKLGTSNPKNSLSTPLLIIWYSAAISSSVDPSLEYLKAKKDYLIVPARARRIFLIVSGLRFNLIVFHLKHDSVFCVIDGFASAVSSFVAFSSDPVVDILATKNNYNPK